ncbi:hypothetical protein Zmor_006749 [Zophobas morio]|uniref:peptidylprolyl isomerase n=1 Tax=Zophobas morio TaxID=2755281 RepID=A0AA38IQQ5_9CUCU|nr:hypothetical protein Zmor_006749 [Zophobas morio]
METVEIVGGLSIKDIAEGGAEFEVQSISHNGDDRGEEEEKEYNQQLENYIKLECLDCGDSYDGCEPFLNIAKNMEDLLPNGKIKKRILKEGYGPKPEESSSVIIHYNAYVQLEAHPFDSTHARKTPHTFKIGQQEVIEGLEIAVRSMRLTEKAQFLIDPELAYRNGVLGRIPPNSVVLFEIELCVVQEQGQQEEPAVNEKHFQVVYNTCLALCVKGKKMFKLQDYQGAIKVYSTAVNKLEDAVLDDYDDQIKSEALLVRLYTNLLICCTHAKIPKRGCVFAQKLYEMSKNGTFEISAKVYFNHAKCQRMIGGTGAYSFAERKLIQAKALEPDNLEIKKELASLREEKEKHRSHERSLGKALLS